ncbi:helix-turn-helix domain-containing protein [Pontimicrobium aquaticum]|uniref:Helix-turn-helix transcriptional regulator n=1 Tax=Pontimicrobium aquaticum TaxID=2565367 RepID=A0A4U0EPN9_9FLAO|nr:helix-turn-helix transcriptional regulator [Pontimicrobium aquaticum]TJY33448.1 helix-turn-helix transcriptional regulator [Pontimicrobium aquaticum]
MINTKDLTKRLQEIIDYYNLSASSFADKIGVQRSSISHILSGRNKPSLDFVMKVLSSFPEVDLYWLLNGKGIFPKTEISSKQKHAISLQQKNEENILDTVAASDIDRIIIFFKDGSFKNYSN